VRVGAVELAVGRAAAAGPPKVAPPIRTADTSVERKVVLCVIDPPTAPEVTRSYGDGRTRMTSSPAVDTARFPSDCGCVEATSSSSSRLDVSWANVTIRAHRRFVLSAASVHRRRDLSRSWCAGDALGAGAGARSYRYRCWPAISRSHPVAAADRPGTGMATLRAPTTASRRRDELVHESSSRSAATNLTRAQHVCQRNRCEALLNTSAEFRLAACPLAKVCDVPA
jgi:hypothetical protein